MQAQSKVLKKKSGQDRLRKPKHNLTWKIFSYHRVSQKSVQNSCRIKNRTNDKRTNKKDESQVKEKIEKVEQQRNAEDLEVKTVPKLDTGGSEGASKSVLIEPSTSNRDSENTTSRKHDESALQNSLINKNIVRRSVHSEEGFGEDNKTLRIKAENEKEGDDRHEKNPKSGTVEELKMYCKTCSVRMVDSKSILSLLMHNGKRDNSKKDEKKALPQQITKGSLTSVKATSSYKATLQVQKAAEICKRKANVSASQPEEKRHRPVLQSTSIVTTVLQSPPIVSSGVKELVAPSSGSLKMKFVLRGNEAISVSGLSSTSENEVKNSVTKVTSRQEIPQIEEQVDPNRPYYQCRHCTFASHDIAHIEHHTKKEHFEHQRYACPLCNLVYFKYQDGGFTMQYD